MLKFFILFLLYLNQSYQSKIELSDLKEIQNLLKDYGVLVDELLDDAKLFNNENSEIIEQASLNNLLLNRDPDIYWSPKEMIEYRGFKYEEHFAITEDCYILTMHRIVNLNDKTASKPPVLLQHGLLDSSSTWISNTMGGNLNDKDDNNLAFALAKRGYDVWLGNIRGNAYSKNHTSFSTFNPRFWKFTFDNHALQDLPAMIGYIQNNTNYNQISYVGHSQGTSIMFELLSIKPEIAKSISSFVALAPIVFLDSMTSPTRYFTDIPFAMKPLLYLNTEFLSRRFSLFLMPYCSSFPFVCKFFMDVFAGRSRNQLNSTRFPTMWNHLPSGTSMPNLVRFGQLIKSGRFEMLDYMSESQNMKCYNQVTPPQIPLQNINLTDMYLINSRNDKLGDHADVQKLYKALKVPFYHRTITEDFSHLDFLFSKNLYELVNKDVIEILKLKKPSITNGIRFKQYTKLTCTLPNSKTHCHMNLESVLRKMI